VDAVFDVLAALDTAMARMRGPFSGIRALWWDPPKLRQQFIEAVQGHDFSLEALRDALDDLAARREGKNTRNEKIGANTSPVQAGFMYDNFQWLLGQEFIDALRDEAPTPLSALDQDENTVNRAVTKLLVTLWRDVNAIPRGHGMLARAALSLPPRT